VSWGTVTVIGVFLLAVNRANVMAMHPSTGRHRRRDDISRVSRGAKPGTTAGMWSWMCTGRAARVAAASHGGQVVVSSATAVTRAHAVDASTELPPSVNTKATRERRRRFERSTTPDSRMARHWSTHPRTPLMT
jgi:hypothetical protein